MKNFNSHAHVERDKMAEYKQHFYVISTHTLTWSVTKNKKQVLVYQWDFNSHAHVERDLRMIVGN